MNRKESQGISRIILRTWDILIDAQCKYHMYNVKIVYKEDLTYNAQ